MTRDYELLRDYLTELGHTTQGLQYDGPSFWEHPFDLAIFLEVIPRNMVNIAPIRWAFLNPEWCNSEKVKLVHRYIDKVFAKTHEAKRIFDETFPGKASYVGFLTRDQWIPGMPRDRKFLHIGGNSSHRGTQALYDAWKWSKNGKRLDAHLYIVSGNLQERPGPEIPNVHVSTWVEELSLKNMQNESLFHIYPAGTEGFGHAMRETLSVGALLITTAAPPMNEIPGAFLIPSTGKGKFDLADVYEVSALDIYDAVEKIFWQATQRELMEKGLTARGAFHRMNNEFKNTFSEHLAELDKPQAATIVTRKKSEKPCIAFIGNFAAEHSTENQILWALEQGLGYEVEKLQENQIKRADIAAACDYSQILMWVRTPGWLQVPDIEMFELLDWCKKRGVKTVSVHLDKFWGIPDREFLIGKIPFWRTEFCFTADGSRQEDFNKRGVNHFYMAPGASEVYSHRGVPREYFRCDVGFVGAKSYHSEHNFRGQLIDFLQQTYDKRFKLIEGGLRGHDLNDFYASCKVCVGDCFGSGKIPNYFSDRMVETPMRYGFLLSPKIKGMEIPLATFEPENFTDLLHHIEYWLSHPVERYNKVIECAEHVRKYDTWTRRMEWILETIAK